MTDEQRRAFEQIPGMTLVSATIEGARGALVRLHGELFVLSPKGYLRRYR